MVDIFFEIFCYAVVVLLVEYAFAFAAISVAIFRIPKWHWREAKQNDATFNYYLNLYGIPIFGYLNICALFYILYLVSENFHKQILLSSFQ